MIRISVVASLSFGRCHGAFTDRNSDSELENDDSRDEGDTGGTPGEDSGENAEDGQ